MNNNEIHPKVGDIIRIPCEVLEVVYTKKANIKLILRDGLTGKKLNLVFKQTSLPGVENESIK